jgi:hypothetical protein
MLKKVGLVLGLSCCSGHCSRLVTAWPRWQRQDAAVCDQDRLRCARERSRTTEGRTPSHPTHLSHPSHPSHPTHLSHPSHLTHLPHPTHLSHPPGPNGLISEGRIETDDTQAPRSEPPGPLKDCHNSGSSRSAVVMRPSSSPTDGPSRSSSGAIRRWLRLTMSETGRELWIVEWMNGASEESMGDGPRPADVSRRPRLCARRRRRSPVLDAAKGTVVWRRTSSRTAVRRI